MRVTITTDGGFTGRGIGSAAADVDETLLSRSAHWDDDYSVRGRDLVRYTMTFGSRSVSWTDGSSLPEEMSRVVEEVWGRRSGVSHGVNG